MVGRKDQGNFSVFGRKRQCLTWVLKGDGLGCAEKVGKAFWEAGIS